MFPWFQEYYSHKNIEKLYWKSKIYSYKIGQFVIVVLNQIIELDQIRLDMAWKEVDNWLSEIVFFTQQFYSDKIRNIICKIKS